MFRIHIFLCLSITSYLPQNVVSLPGQPLSDKNDANDPHSKDDCLIDIDDVMAMHKMDFVFMTAEHWKEVHAYHCKLARIPFFALFKKWKPFYVWRTKIRAKKIHLAKEALQKHLFIVSPVCV